jgi:hypothetical protein
MRYPDNPAKQAIVDRFAKIQSDPHHIWSLDEVLAECTEAYVKAMQAIPAVSEAKIDIARVIPTLDDIKNRTTLHLKKIA